MRCVSWLAAASLVVVTAGCVEQSGYPTTYGYSPGYGSNYGYAAYSNNYVSQPGYYRPAPTYYAPPPPPPRPQVVTQTRYVAVPVSPPPPSYHRARDSDRDGIPDRYDRDKNGDGVPDRVQRSRW